MSNSANDALHGVPRPATPTHSPVTVVPTAASGINVRCTLRDRPTTRQARFRLWPTDRFERDTIDILKRLSRKPIEPAPDSELLADLGFDSLQVLELVGELEDHFNIAVPLNALDPHPHRRQIVAGGPTPGRRRAESSAHDPCQSTLTDALVDAAATATAGLPRRARRADVPADLQRPAEPRARSAPARSSPPASSRATGSRWSSRRSATSSRRSSAFSRPAWCRCRSSRRSRPATCRRFAVSRAICWSPAAPRRVVTTADVAPLLDLAGARAIADDWSRLDALATGLALAAPVPVSARRHRAAAVHVRVDGGAQGRRAVARQPRDQRRRHCRPGRHRRDTGRRRRQLAAALSRHGPHRHAADRGLLRAYDAVIMSPVLFLKRPTAGSRRSPSTAAPSRSPRTSPTSSACAGSSRRRLRRSTSRAGGWPAAAPNRSGRTPCSAFAERFASAGFRDSSFVPSYGLAEHSLAVSMARDGVLVDRVDAARLGRDSVAVPAQQRLAGRPHRRLRQRLPRS